MKKLITAILLFSTALTLSFAAPKKGKEKEQSNGIKLDPKKKYAIEGVELGSDNWPQVTLSNKGEIIWNPKQGDFQQIGWELRGTDLSKYAGIRVELAAGQNFEEPHVWLENPASTGDWGFNFAKDGVCYALFNGQNKGWGDMKNPDVTQGFLIKIGGNLKQFKKTVIKSIELIKKEDVRDASNLTILDVPFGTSVWQSHILGNEVIWANGDGGGDAGWDLSGIDLSEYDRVRVELESNTCQNIGLRLCDSTHNNWHGFNTQVEPNVFDVYLSGQGASWVSDNGTDFDKTQGLKIIIQSWDRTKEEKTLVKSVQLLKGERTVNEAVMIGDKMLGSSGWSTKTYENGLIEWVWNGKEHYPCAGWYVKDIDFSEYTKIRVEFEPEASTLPLRLDLYQEKNDSGVEFDAISNSFIEANLDGSYFDGKWENKGKWDPSKKIDQIWIRYCDLSTDGQKSIVKSVTLINEEIKAPQADELMLKGSKLGTRKDNAIVDENSVINWKKANYAQCGWQFDKLEGEILEVKVSSTDCPLRLRIRDRASQNEASWDDDGSGLFRINLKTKKKINENGKESAPEWQKSSKAFLYEAGGDIVIEPINGVSKDGKQSVVEYIKVE
jgi:hypothetical protein